MFRCAVSGASENPIVLNDMVSYMRCSHMSSSESMSMSLWQAKREHFAQ